MTLISSTEPPAIASLGSPSTKPEEYGSDILWGVGDGWWGIQRKAVFDLISSVKDGRLSKEVTQMKGLQQGILIVEGNVQWSLEGTMIGNDYGTWTTAQHYGILASCQLKGIWYFESRNQEHTVAIARQLMVWSKKEAHNSLESRPFISQWGQSKDEGYLLFLLQGIPGMGVELARRVIAKYGNPLGWKISKEDLMSIDGIGAKKAEKMWLALEKESGPSGVTPPGPQIEIGST